MDPKAAFRSGPKGQATGGLAAGALPATGVGILCVRVTGHSTDWKRFDCRRLDGAGNNIGESLEVWAFSYDPDEPGTQTIGEQDLRLCHPYYEAGSVLRISWQTIWTGVEWKSAYWALDTFERVGCP